MRILWVGDITRSHSLSILARTVVHYLAQHHDVYVRETGNHAVIEDEKNDLLQALKAKPLPSRLDLEIRCSYPAELGPTDARKLIVYQPWELHKVPIQWREDWNLYADSVCGICKFNQQVFARELTTHTHYIPPIIHPIFYQDYEHKSDGRLTFLYDGGTTWRKGFDILVNAYVPLFEGNPNVHLIYKDSKVYNSNIWEALKTSNISVEYNNGLLPWEDLHDLYRRADIFLYPSRGEGLGYGAAQAVTMGIPTVAPAHTGLDFITDESAFPVDYVGTPVEHATISERWLDPRLGLEFDGELRYPEPKRHHFVNQILAAMTSHIKHDRDWYRAHMNRYTEASVVSQWMEYIDEITS